MGWYSHPDTLTMAHASGVARRWGHPESSLQWLIAYRDAYEAKARQSAAIYNLEAYLERLDARIESIRSEETQPATPPAAPEEAR